MFRIIVECIVHVDCQSFQWGKFQGKGVPEVILRGLTWTHLIQNCGKVGVITLTWPVTIRMFYRHERLCVVTDPWLSVHGILGKSVQFGTDIACLHGYVHPVVDVIIDIVHHIELTEALIPVTHQWSLVHITHRGIISGLVATTVNIYIILLDRVSFLIHLFHPIRISAIGIFAGLTVSVLPAAGVLCHKDRKVVDRIIEISLYMLHFLLTEQVTAAGRIVCGVHPVRIFHGIHIFRTGCRAVEWDRCIEWHLCRHILAAALGCDKDNTISGTGSIDRGRSCILQYRYACHILRIDQVRVHLYSVNQNQRATTVDGRFTADIEAWAFSRLSAGGDVQVRDCSLQTLSQIDDGTVCQHFVIDGRNRTGQIGFLDSRITYNNNLIQGLAVLFQRDF